MFGRGGYFCVEGISREALRLVTTRIQLRARVSVTARLIFVTAPDGFYFIFLPSRSRAGCCEQRGGCLEYYTFSHRMHNKHAQQSAAAILPDSVCIGVHAPKKAFLFLSFKKIVLITPRLSHDVTSSLSCFVGRRCGQSSSYLHCKYPVLLFQV